MADLAAQQVVDMLAAQLAAVVSLGAERITTDRCWPIPDEGLPFARVLHHDESVRELRCAGPTGPRSQQHALQVAVELLARAVEGMDDALSALQRDALAALFSSAAEGARRAARIQSVQLLGARRQMPPEGQAAIGMVRIELLATYGTRSDQPDVLV